MPKIIHVKFLHKRKGFVETQSKKRDKRRKYFYIVLKNKN
jgi:hypothetical protein